MSQELLADMDLIDREIQSNHPNRYREFNEASANDISIEMGRLNHPKGAKSTKGSVPQSRSNANGAPGRLRQPAKSSKPSGRFNESFEHLDLADDRFTSGAKASENQPLRKQVTK